MNNETPQPEHTSNEPTPQAKPAEVVDIATFPIRFTRCDVLLTTDSDERCDYMLDEVRSFIWIDARLSAARQLKCIKAVLGLVDESRGNKLPTTK